MLSSDTEEESVFLLWIETETLHIYSTTSAMQSARPVLDTAAASLVSFKTV